MIKRSHPSWYVPGAPMDIGDALKHLDDVEPDGSAAAYQDALEAVHTHIRRMGADCTEQSRLRQLAVEQMEMWRQSWAETRHLATLTQEYAEQSRLCEPAVEAAAPPRFNVNADPPVYPSWAEFVAKVPPTFRGKLATAEELHGSGSLPVWSDEQFAKIKTEWEGFVPREGLGQGHPECPTCERRVQEGEQPPFPTVQARQWINHGGRVWTRLCEACRALRNPT
jgi:hypothetical protein